MSVMVVVVVVAAVVAAGGWGAERWSLRMLRAWTVEFRRPATGGGGAAAVVDALDRLRPFSTVPVASDLADGLVGEGAEVIEFVGEWVDVLLLLLPLRVEVDRTDKDEERRGGFGSDKETFLLLPLFSAA